MTTALWFLLFAGGVLGLAYQRVSLRTATLAAAIALVAYTVFRQPTMPWLVALWLAFGVLALLNIDAFRLRFVTRPFLRTYRRMLPSMSDTEREALEAGTVWWDGELFTGRPDWDKLLAAQAPQLTAEEQAFIDGPCEELCRMIDDWDITHRRADLPPEVWDFLKQQRLLRDDHPEALRRPRVLGLCALVRAGEARRAAARRCRRPSRCRTRSAPANCCCTTAPRSRRTTTCRGSRAARTCPASRSPAPRAGSDAASIPDTGVVCRGLYEGREVVGLRLNFSKRYITLAPVATVVGLAFKLFDPDQLLGGDKTDYGITCALIPRDTPGLAIGRRHFPLNIPFQNGPLSGQGRVRAARLHHRRPEDGGPGLAHAGRAALGRPLHLAAVERDRRRQGRHLRLRRVRAHPQAVQPAGRQVRGRRGGARRAWPATPTSWTPRARSPPARSTAARSRPCRRRCSSTTAPSCARAGRQRRDGRARRQGHLPRARRTTSAAATRWCRSAITVEGANILTRSLIIFGQGAIRCHPYVLREMNAAKEKDKRKSLREFDQALFGHIGFTLSNAARSLVMALTFARFSAAPDDRADRAATTSTSTSSARSSPSPPTWRC